MRVADAWPSPKRARGVTKALTADHHFEQPGFVSLLKE